MGSYTRHKMALFPGDIAQTLYHFSIPETLTKNETHHTSTNRRN